MHKKRRNQPHIVLPSGMWRYVSKKGKKAKRSRRSVSMPRRSRRRSSSRRMGGKLERGFIHPTGLIAAALLGAGAATLADNVGLTNAVPFGKYVAGFAVGGIGGVGGVFIRDMIKGTLSVGGTSGNMFNYP